MGDIYLRPQKKFRLTKNQLLKRLKLPYGLSGAGDYWDATIVRHVNEDLGVTKSALDNCLYFRQIRGKLHELAELYVIDIIHTGTPDFLDLSSKTEKKFQSIPREYDAFRFAVIHIFITSQKTSCS